MQQGGEPSLEEILASIKKVMAREESDSRHAGGDRIEPAHEDEATDILDLAEEDMLVPDEDAPSAASPGRAGHDASGPNTGPADAPPAEGAELPRRDAASAIRESLAALERLGQRGPDAATSSSADPSLEALTRAMLRPMLAEWLEANLPAIVERLVQAEIARIVDRNS